MTNKKEIKKMAESPKDRKSVIREAFLKVTEPYKPQIAGESSFVRSFDIRRIVDLPETRGALRDYMKVFKPEDKKLFREVLQELKAEGILFHKSAYLWARNE